MPDKILDHSSHWKSWTQYDLDRVACSKCGVVLYEGQLPTNTKTILEVLDRDFLNLPIIAVDQKEILKAIDRRLEQIAEVTDVPKELLQMPRDTDTNLRLARPPADSSPDPTPVGDYNDGPPDEAYNQGTYNEAVEDSQQEAKGSHPSNKIVNPVREVSPMDVTSKALNDAGAQVALRSVFSRTVKDPTADFGSITAGFEITETFPGTMGPQDIAEVATEQYILLKAQVLAELGLPFEQDPETRRIMEAFPGSQMVASTGAGRQARPAPQAAPAGRPAGVRGNGRQAAPQPSRGARKAPAPVTPSRDELWANLLDYPDRWFDQSADKRSPGMPDFLSLDYNQDDGWPVGLWMEYQGRSTCPDIDALNAIPLDAFAQTRPSRRN